MYTITRHNVDLPPELYREVAKNLHRPSDRPALLSLSLVNSVWREESQRALFTDVWDGYYDKSEVFRRKWVYTHLLFLQAICAHPGRLGPYVRSYGQFMLAWDSEGTKSRRIYQLRCDHQGFKYDEQDSLLLWELTMEALPALINLEHLSFMSGRFRFPDNDAGHTIRGCQFQLKSLAWNCSDIRHDSELPEFLRTQNSLIHLNFLGPWMYSRRQHPKLPKDACPSLTSVTCAAHTFPSVSSGRNILGFKMTDNNPRQIAEPSFLELDPTSTAQIRYLSVHKYTSRHGSAFRSIILMEIENWNMETIQSLDNLPELRTLVLGSPMGAPDITGDEDARLSVVVEAHKRCPSLDRILHTSNLENTYERRYSEFSITRSADGDHVPKVGHRKVHRDVEIGGFWWDAYSIV